jgi:hypothetical protein
MVRAVLPLVAEAFDADGLEALHSAESHAGTPPALVAAIVASNVPALALPAIAHACLAGASVLIKSGRADRLSAPAFRRHLADVDRALAATIVDAYWPGGDAAVEDVAVARADVVVATGSDATVATVAARLGDRVVAHGDRTSLAVVSHAPADDELLGLAWDVARYEQRGCLSPHTVFVTGDPRAVAERLRRALDAVAVDVPMPAATIGARAAHRVAIESAVFHGATVLRGDGGTVLIEPEPAAATPIGARSVHVRPLDDSRRLDAAFPTGRIECVGVGRGIALDVESLRVRGVSRVCPVGRMQRPRIDWPRGQRPALASLFRAPGEARIQFES